MQKLCASLLILRQKAVKILLIDNFDSFTFNLAHYLEGMGADVHVLREDKYGKGMGDLYDKIILSPGSGLPTARKGMMLCLDEYLNVKPILGVCLGMQALVVATGGTLFNQEIVKHGVDERINRVEECVLLKDVPEQFKVGLYHSWAVDVSNVVEWIVTSKSKSDIIMSIESNTRKLFGVQFHPESIMTLEGKKILSNFLAQ